MLDFATLERPRAPNTCLALPPGCSARATADLESPVFSMPAERLEQAVLALADREPRTLHASSDAATRQHGFVQRSRLLRFPDEIVVRIVEQGEGASSLAVYSRSRCGYSDFGVNRRRVERWLAALREQLGE